uniref:Uncharacterized protein n=1 Tax=Oryza brachyantha TaxID=4533 RepID=J3ND60_ORYBR
MVIKKLSDLTSQSTLGDTGDWWEAYGDYIELQKLAKTIVSQCLSSGGYAELHEEIEIFEPEPLPPTNQCIDEVFIDLSSHKFLDNLVIVKKKRAKDEEGAKKNKKN